MCVCITNGILYITILRLDSNILNDSKAVAGTTASDTACFAGISSLAVRGGGVWVTDINQIYFFLKLEYLGYPMTPILFQSVGQCVVTVYQSDRLVFKKQSNTEEYP